MQARYSLSHYLDDDLAVLNSLVPFLPNEQELLAEILRIAAPALEGYRQLKADVQQSLKEGETGLDQESDFEAVRQQLRAEHDKSGRRK